MNIGSQRSAADDLNWKGRRNGCNNSLSPGRGEGARGARVPKAQTGRNERKRAWSLSKWGRTDETQWRLSDRLSSETIPRNSILLIGDRLLPHLPTIQKVHRMSLDRSDCESLCIPIHGNFSVGWCRIQFEMRKPQKLPTFIGDFTDRKSITSWICNMKPR
jgi:hypothetical protein